MLEMRASPLKRGVRPRPVWRTTMPGGTNDLRGESAHSKRIEVKVAFFLTVSSFPGVFSPGTRAALRSEERRWPT